MAGRRWTREDLEMLQQYNGTCTCAVMARRLGRSENAVRLKMNRTGLLGFERATDRLTAFQIRKAIGIEPRTLQYWSRLGLRIIKVGHYNTVKQEDLVKFMRAHPEKWDSRKIKDDSIFMNAPWFLEKKKQDRDRIKSRWSKQEVSRLIIRYRQGVPIRQIAEEMGRTESSIKCKMHYMTSRGFRI